MKEILLGLYVVVLLFSGVYAARHTKTLDGFFLGGRSLGPWLSAFAYGTTYFSAVIFIGYAGKVGWGFGMAALWVALGNTLIGSALSWLVLAKPTRRMTEQLNAMTMPEFLAARYESPYLKHFAALIIFVFLIPYSASVYMGLSYLFEHVFFLSYSSAVVLMAVFTAIYLIVGGYRAIAMADVIQGSLMIGGVFVLVYFVLGAPEVNGLANAIEKLRAIDPKLVSPSGPPGWIAIGSLVLLTSLGPWGLPQMVQKFYAIKNDAVVRSASVVATLFALVITFGAYFAGSLTRLFFSQMPLDAVTGKPNPDLLIPQIIIKTLPEWGSALILLLVLSASMSTLSSLVLVSSSAVAIDLLPARQQHQKVLWMRILCAVFILFSVVTALKPPSIILSLMAISWGTVAGAFLAPYLYGLFFPKGTAAAAWVCALLGLAISTGGSIYFKLDPSKTPLLGSLAMLIPLVVFPLVSLVTPRVSKEQMSKLFPKIE
ncbi:MAG TPA: sodium:solute symporter family protein [Candidatus Hydrogenedentes bacterium]|nr:sodium:solute symporter family protein [Candidatus Hydrogenedentota bacterium]HOL75901.1 sodium:solute symporter family protein [Candidatus Hydrogenedentota bacterium]HPO85690.1 sodium:solute symporter family protein [Candidatus Hydrogenedentota bacterium]